MTAMEVKNAKSSARSISTGAGIAIAGMWFATFLITALGAYLTLLADIQENLKRMEVKMDDFVTLVIIILAVVWIFAGILTTHLLDD